MELTDFQFQVIKHLKYSTVAVPPSYEDSFRKAMMTFQHQRVYDPMVEDIAHLSNLPDDVSDDLDFLGPYPWFITNLTCLILC